VPCEFFALHRVRRRLPLRDFRIAAAAARYRVISAIRSVVAGRDQAISLRKAGPYSRRQVPAVGRRSASLATLKHNFTDYHDEIAARCYLRNMLGRPEVFADRMSH
jgi:hypothetical protein